MVRVGGYNREAQVRAIALCTANARESSEKRILPATKHESCPTRYEPEEPPRFQRGMSLDGVWLIIILMVIQMT